MALTPGDGKLVERGEGVFEWVTTAAPATAALTSWELLLLLREHTKYGVKSVNEQRAMRVKSLMEDGIKQADIVYLLGHEGYGETMVKRDFAALLLSGVVARKK